MIKLIEKLQVEFRHAEWIDENLLEESPGIVPTAKADIGTNQIIHSVELSENPYSGLCFEEVSYFKPFHHRTCFHYIDT